MNEAAALLVGSRDFTSFSKLHTDVKTNICDLRRAQWHCIDISEGRWYFEIAADRFLRNMVRAVVGTSSMWAGVKYHPPMFCQFSTAKTAVPPEPQCPAKHSFCGR